MILILSEPGDETAQAVVDKLERRGADFLWFDNEQFPAAAQVSWELSPGGASEGLRLRLGERTCDLSRVTGVWYRRPGLSHAHAEIEDPVTRAWVEQHSRQFLSNIWSNLDCFWIPGPRWSVRRAEQKNLQLRLAAEIGLEIPPTLMTNSPAEFLDFYRRNNGNIISKPVRGGFVWKGAPYESKVSAIVYTENVTNRDLGYLPTIRYCPVIVQAYVPKLVELRITVVGEQVFAAEIHSQDSARSRHDWRHYDLYHTVHRRHELPGELAVRLVRLVERLGLCFGAIDMILTPDGRYVFLEINPNGEYGWIESLTGLPISDAICDLLLAREESGALPSRTLPGPAGEQQ
ncbi:MAG TPA: ATP-dependent carboxylate-amine ligase [Blastocatellia bacterium]|nr:ATP-dependent carboxylate-amine ligase [Blastocatellia bacterium]